MIEKNLKIFQGLRPWTPLTHFVSLRDGACGAFGLRPKFLRHSKSFELSSKSQNFNLVTGVLELTVAIGLY